MDFRLNALIAADRLQEIARQQRHAPQRSLDGAADGQRRRRPRHRPDQDKAASADGSLSAMTAPVATTGND
jgi:hypothetical protein